jgi:hypothetical protein
MKVRKLELADYGKFIRFGRGKMLNLWVSKQILPMIFYINRSAFGRVDRWTQFRN